MPNFAYIVDHSKADNHKLSIVADPAGNEEYMAQSRKQLASHVNQS